MTQLGDGVGAGYDPGGPVGGEVLAERYQLEQYVNTDSAGRQIWYGSDIVLRRPVAVVIRYPGGEAAAQMLQTAVEASRIVHPNLVGVYDAIDEGARAYLVREWIEGGSLRDRIAAGPFEADQAVAVAHAVAAAVNAVHASGLTHGNIHPGTVLIDMDGRVVLADAGPDRRVAPEEDVRAVGAVLYYALTGYWPHVEVPGPGSLPDGLRDPAGGLAAPRQVRAGIPDHVDNLTMDLLDRRLTAPSADLLAGELAHLDGPVELAAEPAAYGVPDRTYSTGPIQLTAGATEPPRSSGRKIALGMAGLLVIGVVGLLVGLNFLTGSPPPPPAASGDPTQASPSAGAPPTNAPTAVPLTADQLRIVDPPNGDRTELDGVDLLVDGDLSTAWQTDSYNSAAFGNLKPGMGILIDLGEPRQVATVRLELAEGGATAELRAGSGDPGSSAAGDEQVYQSFEPVGEPQEGGTTIVFDGLDPEQTYQYLMVWFTHLPADGDGFRVSVQQLVVEGY